MLAGSTPATCDEQFRRSAVMQVRQLRMPDTRSIYGSSVVLQRMYGYERKRLQATLRELLFRNTPSARR